MNAFLLKKLSLGLIILLIVLINALRFWKLDSVPSGYYINELASAVTLQCFAERGCDAELRPWPLFGAMQYGQDKPPTYVYPGIIWVKLFGSTVASLRGFSAFILLIGMGGLFLLAWQLGGSGLGLLTVLAATFSPWAWVVNRVALESFFAPIFAIWGLYFFRRSILGKDWAAAGFLFACAMYAYPPARLQLPLMMATLVFYEWGRRAVPRRSILSLTAVFVLSLIPMAVIYWQGGLSRRFNEISIFNKDYLYVTGKNEGAWESIRTFFHNYFLHLSPDFLFRTGDQSYVYSTRHLGLLSWLDISALVILAAFLLLAVLRPSWSQNPVRRHKRWLIFLAANFFIGIIPSALTNQELPHALRTCGSWPFMMLLTGLMWSSAGECLAMIWPAAALIGALSGGMLLYQYFAIYPSESKIMFGFRAREIAEHLTTQEDWKQFLTAFHKQQYHCRYFLAHRLGISCKEARDIWQQI